MKHNIITQVITRFSCIILIKIVQYIIQNIIYRYILLQIN